MHQNAHVFCSFMALLIWHAFNLMVHIFFKEKLIYSSWIFPDAKFLVQGFEVAQET